MPKRFTATEKWKDIWFKKLEPKNKLLWIYLLDECDNAGLIELDLEIAGVLTGFKYSTLDVRETYKTRLFQITEDVWFIPKFILFQYPKGLSNNDNVTKNVVNKLQKYNLLDENLDLRETYRISNLDIQVIYKDKEEVKVMVKEKEEQKKNISKIIPPEFDWIIERCGVMNYPEYETESEKFFDYYNSNGWKVGKNNMKDWTSALSNWFKNYKTYNQNGITTKSDSRNSKGFDVRKNTWYTGT